MIINYFPAKHLKILTLANPQKEGLTNYTKRSDTIRVTRAIKEFGFFKKFFFILLGPKNFKWPHFWGVILLKLYDPCHGFWRFSEL